MAVRIPTEIHLIGAVWHEGTAGCGVMNLMITIRLRISVEYEVWHCASPKLSDYRAITAREVWRWL